MELVIQQTQKYNGQDVLQLKENLDTNCVVDLIENIILLGTDKGLYSYNNQRLLHISGLESVHQITLIPNFNMALMIVDINRILIKCDLQHLKDVSQCAPFTQPKINFSNVNINNLSGFHIFQTSNYNKQLTLGIATSKQIVVLIYDLNCQDFKPLRILDTAEPTSCMRFTEHSLIIGADKFFEVDLNTFEADEFLDVSDHKLSHAIMCSSIKSFPLAIMQISKNPLEYLVCFKEFATFVDEYGRSSREYDLKWNHLPLAFYYHAPYLYIATFLTIEIIKISVNRNVYEECTFKINYNNLRYLGNSKKGIYVKVGNAVKIVDAKSLDYDVSFSSSESEQNNDTEESDRFSFTSSMVHSLDGHLSDDEGDEMETKKVQFTDL